MGARPHTALRTDNLPPKDWIKNIRRRIEADSPYFYLLLDDKEVQDALVEEGREAVRFTDENIENVQHETVRVLEPGHITEA